jgi:hypothetical protein
VRLRLLVFAAVATYTSGFLLWYSATALGLAPMLDGREQLELAARIAQGNLPHEPFYRAALFPSLVAWLLKAGVSATQLPFASRLLNGVLHLASTGLVWMIAAHVWRTPSSAALAAVLFGMNPVVLHFAGDPLDLSLAMSFMLGGVLASLHALDGTPASRVMAMAAGILLASASLARPQLVVLLPMWILWLASHRGVRRLLAWSMPPMLLVLALMGAANLAVGGAFQVLPWQGAYNLWAANGPDANGRYFVQRERQAVYREGGNPARIESERRYRREQPGAPDDYASMSRYWQQRTLAHVRAEPWTWLKLVASKAWYLLNDFEQYDIKTYHFHKARSPWLRWNPLGWSWLLAGASAALVMHARNRRAWTVAVFAACYAAGLLLAYVSARFRLPLVPLLAVLAGGLLHGAPRAASRRALATALLLFGLARLPLPPGEAERTVVQDYLLNARAAAVLGFTDEALRDAHAALTRAPGDAAARELLCVAAFNAWLRAADYRREGPTQACAEAAADSPSAQRALGVLWWRAGRGDEARALWRALVIANGDERDAALAALVMVDGARHRASLERGRMAQWSDELLLALALRGDPQARVALASRMSSAEIARQTAALTALFAPPSER